ncbi:MAG: glycoside hydrolase family 97 catalytic domain-containing protein [Bacteroidia bacterium]|nr:glycoside hydrolase family 97 catalytic domain-containing protein [Bacteroidia bacterium]
MTDRVPPSGDMLSPIPELDIPELVTYAAERNVRLILWTVFNVLDDKLEETCAHYADMGIAGFKVDFLDRGDQTAVEMAWRIAEAAARHHLVLDYHGLYPPAGMNRTWPNVLNFESVFGMEEVKWGEASINMPEYLVTFPFIRQMCGYTDFTPGAMLNATQKDFQPVYSNPFSLGTRGQQAAIYIVVDSPLTMLCDTPSRYMKEKEYTAFISTLPRTYEQTLCLDGEMGGHVVIARRAGENWYVGGLADWNGKEVELKLGFLGDGEYDLQLLRDGANADKNAQDYALERRTVRKGESVRVRMASGGGFALKLIKKQ